MQDVSIRAKGSSFCKIDNLINENETLQTGKELLEKYLGEVENTGSGI